MQRLEPLPEKKSAFTTEMYDGNLHMFLKGTKAEWSYDFLLHINDDNSVCKHVKPAYFWKLG